MPSRHLLPPILLIMLTCALALCVRHGRAGVALSDDPIWQDTGDQEGGQFGYAVASAGDVNADGFADVLVGVPRYTHEIYREGVVLAYYGSHNGLRAEPDFSAGGGLTGSEFGHAVSTAGDVDGDGFDDVIVGAPSYKDGQTTVGAAFLFSGSEAGLVITPTWTYLGNQQAAQLGISAGLAGDVNGDGFDDVIIGANLFTNEYATEGAAFVFYGSQDGLGSEPDWSAYGGQKAAAYGYAVGGAGDVNGDGFDDVVVGAPYYNVLEGNEGAVYLYYGSSNGLQEEPAWVKLGNQLLQTLGTSVAIVPDVNQDGLDEVAAGAPAYSSEELIREGAAYLFFGRQDSVPRETASWIGYGAQPSSGYGISVRGAGDVNADGYGDLLVGANSYSFYYTPLKDNNPSEGAAFLYFGDPQGVHSFPLWKAYGPKADASFGNSVSAAGDIDGDGCDDFIVGAPDFMILKNKMGAAFVFNGAPFQINVTYLPLVR